MWRTSICWLKTTLFPPSQMENFKCSLTCTSASGGKLLCSSVWPDGVVAWWRGMSSSQSDQTSTVWAWPLTNCQRPAGPTLLQCQDSPNFPRHHWQALSNQPASNLGGDWPSMYWPQHSWFQYLISGLESDWIPWLMSWFMNWITITLH